ncbi:MAG: hypothetical protein C0391_03625 [Anaerolinea sp.]|nr:hypothetical protein [Anaerolinea sp.]
MIRNPSMPQSARLPNLSIPKKDAENSIQQRIEIGKKISSTPVNSEEELRKYTYEFNKWNDYNYALLLKIVDTDYLLTMYPQSHKKLATVLVNWTYDYKRKKDQFSACIVSLESFLPMLDLFTENSLSPKDLKPKQEERDLSKVFIVHGHDDGMKNTVARFIESLGMQPIILHEQVSESQTIIEKIERYSEVVYAVVLFSPDDRLESDSTYRVRQNVLIELGLFIGKLGRKKICVLKKGELDLPSDLHGLIWIDFDVADGWKHKLTNEINASGLKIDPGLLLGS